MMLGNTRELGVKGAGKVCHCGGALASTASAEARSASASEVKIPIWRLSRVKVSNARPGARR